jgi:hypothetical protein
MQSKQNELYDAIENQDINLLKKLVIHKRVDLSDGSQYAIRLAAGNGFIEGVKLLLSFDAIKPSYSNNIAIIWANDNNHTNVVQLLWENPIIKKTLKKDRLNLYNKLTTLDIKNKVNHF